MDQLLGEPSSDVVDVPTALLRGHLRVEHDLQQQIAQLVSDRIGIAGIDRFEQLVRLLKQGVCQALMRLLPVPRTATRSAKSRHDLHQIEKTTSLFG